MIHKVINDNIEFFYGLDCMDEELGLPSLKDKLFDLCFTDPPWNIDYKGAIGSGGLRTKSDCFYNDKIPEYKEKCKIWFSEMKRISNTIVMTTGNQNLISGMWHDISRELEFPIKDILIHYKPNGTYGSCIGTFNNFDVYLFFGKTHSWFNSNVIKEPATNQFLRERNYTHPSPKNRKVWTKIVKAIKPESVLDPFMGSGLTAYICEILDIPFRGYELIEEEYYSDWEIRHHDAQNELQQKRMF